MCDPRAEAVASLIHQLTLVLQFYAVLLVLACVYLVVVFTRRKH